MARDEGEPQAMSDERLEAITRRFHVAAGMPVEATTQIERDALALLAEVERLRAREAALKSHVDESINDVLQSILESGGLPPELFPLDHARVTVSSIYGRLQQARALLAAADERSGGDGA